MLGHRGSGRGGRADLNDKVIARFDIFADAGVAVDLANGQAEVANTYFGVANTAAATGGVQVASPFPSSQHFSGTVAAA